MGFFALLSLLERLIPAEARIGGDGPFAQEPVRLRHDPSLTFSAGDVARMVPTEPPAGGGPSVEVVTTFLGVSGAVGPLPSHFGEEIAQEDGASIRRDFLDLFHHRLLSVLFRGLTRYDVPAEARADADDPWSRRLLALTGVDAYSAPSPLPPGLLLRLAPLLSTCRRPAEALELLLAEMLADELGDARIEVIPFTGEWSEIEPAQRMRLGRANHRLGDSAVLGQRVFDRSNTFTVRMAPLTQGAYQQLMPGGDLHARVESAVSFFTGNSLEFELELGLAAPPALRLSRTATTRLGRDTWLGARPGATEKTLRVRGRANT